MTEAEAPILLAVEGSVATVTLNRPRRLNALDAEMARAFAESLARLRGDAGIRAVLLRGEGRSFCAGGDVGRFLDGEPADAIAAILDPFHEGLRTLDALGVPTVAAVQGPVAGGGFSLAMACDLCLAADDAVFTTAYAKIGASPDGSLTYRLPRIVGPRKALELAMLSEPVPASEALRLGLVNRIVPRDALDGEASALAVKLASGPGDAYVRIRKLIDASLGNGLAAQLDAERSAFLQSTTTADFREGVSAFLAKRPGHFTGN